MIQRIKLTNWRSHENSELEFTGGTNALLGIMGSGKSSVLQAIVFALYGDLAETREKKIKLDDLIMFKPEKKPFALVELMFGAQGTWWKVKRRVDQEKGTTYAELRKGDQLVESGPAKVTDYITNLLGVSFDLFTKAVYAKQNEIDYFLTLPKGKRMEKIDELLRLDKLEEARQELSSAVNKLRGSVEALENLVKSRDKEALGKSVEELSHEFQELSRQEKEYREKIEKLKGERESNQKDLDNLEQKKKSIELMEKEYFALDKRKRELSQKLKLLEMFSSIQNPEEKLEQLKKQRGEAEQEHRKKSKLEGEKSSLQQRLIELQSQMRELESLGSLDEALADKKKLENEVIGLKLKIDELNSKVMDSDYQKLNGEIVVLEKEYQQVQSKLKSFKSSKAIENAWSELDKSILEVESSFRSLGKIEGIGKPQDTVEKAFRMAQLTDQQLRQKIDDYSASKPAEAQLKELQQRELQLKSEVSKLGGSILSAKKSVQEVKDQISELKSKLDCKTEELMKLQSDLEKIKNRKNLEEEKSNSQGRLDEIAKLLSETKVLDLREIDLKIEQTQKATQYFELEKENAAAVQKFNEIEMKLNKTGFDQDKYNTVKNEKLKIVEELSALTAKLSSMGQLVAEKEKLITRTRDDLRELERSEAELEKSRRIVERAQILGNALKDAQQILRMEFLTTVNNSMTSLWDILYPYEDYPNIKMSVQAEGSKKGDYNLELQDRLGNWISIDLVSGGERSMACLALRIAFAKVLVPSFKLLVLDEPTHNLDSRGVEELSNALRERVSDLVDQVLVITHDERLEKAVTGACYRLSRNKRLDEPSKVISL